MRKEKLPMVRKRKINRLMLGTTILFMVLIYSCRKNNDLTPISSQNLKKIAISVGNIHNEGLNFNGIQLDSMLSKKKTVNKFWEGNKLSLLNSIGFGATNSESPEITPEMIILSTSNYLSTLPGYAGIDLNNNIDQIEMLNEMYSDFTDSGIKLLYNKITNSAKYNPIVSQREKDLMNQIELIFNNSYDQNLNPVELRSYLRSQLQSLKDQNINTSWSENEGELFYGSVEIALSSTDYWCSVMSQNQISIAQRPNMNLFSRNKIAMINNSRSSEVVGPLIPEENFISTPGFIQTDLLGYIQGWLTAVYKDMESPGGLQPSGQYKRIKLGAATAIVSSTLGFIKLKLENQEQLDLGNLPGLDLLPGVSPNPGPNPNPEPNPFPGGGDLEPGLIPTDTIPNIDLPIEFPTTPVTHGKKMESKAVIKVKAIKK